jgi:hypothetical protein
MYNKENTYSEEEHDTNTYTTHLSVGEFTAHLGVNTLIRYGNCRRLLQLENLDTYLSRSFSLQLIRNFFTPHSGRIQSKHDCDNTNRLYRSPKSGLLDKNGIVSTRRVCTKAMLNRRGLIPVDAMAEKARRFRSWTKEAIARMKSEKTINEQKSQGSHIYAEWPRKGHERECFGK